MQAMLILTLIDVQYSWKVLFIFEKGSNGQNHSSSGSDHPVKKMPPPAKFLTPPPLTAIWKTVNCFNSGYYMI